MIVVELRILLLYHQSWLLWIANSTPYSLHGQHLDLLPHSVTWLTLPKVYPILWFWNWSTRDFWVAKKISLLVWRITQGDFANLSANATAICDPTRALFLINAISRHGLRIWWHFQISMSKNNTENKYIFYLDYSSHLGVRILAESEAPPVSSFTLIRMYGVTSAPVMCLTLPNQHNR